MSWRNHKTHREESKAVKDALLKAGFTDVKVSHGVGTAWAWLLIYCSAKPGLSFQYNRVEAIRIAQDVTGRHGDYAGDINIYFY